MIDELFRCPNCGAYRKSPGYCDKECAETRIADLEAQVAELLEAISEHLGRLERTNIDSKTHSICHNGLYEAQAKAKEVQP